MISLCFSTKRRLRKSLHTKLLLTLSTKEWYLSVKAYLGPYDTNISLEYGHNVTIKLLLRYYDKTMLHPDPAGKQSA